MTTIITTSAGPTNSIRTRYGATYLRAAQAERVYEQLCYPVEKHGIEKACELGETIQINMLQDIPRGTTPIPQTTDVEPVTISDVTATITTTSRWVAVKEAERVKLDVYTNWANEKVYAVGKASKETLDLMAQNAALQGSFVIRAAARASLDAGSTGHYWTDEAVNQAYSTLLSMKVPPFMGNGRNQYFCIAHTDVLHDLRLQGNVKDVAVYQDKEIIMDFELGQIGPFKIIATPMAKVFWGAGAARSTSFSTTLGTAITALSSGKTLTAASSTNLDHSVWVNICDTVETGDTHYDTNERVRYISNSGAVLTYRGEGANGSNRWAHATTATLNNSDSVYPVAYGGPQSIAKAWASSVGEFGTMVEKVDGLLNQFQSLGFKWYGGYGMFNDTYCIRGEYSCSLQA